jgi:hypothetical protein
MLIFFLWAAAPGISALIFLSQTSQNRSWDRYMNEHGTEVLVWIGLSWISCSLACSWLMGRLTRRWWAKLLFAFFLGLGLFIVNLLVTFFASCSMMHVTM